MTNESHFELRQCTTNKNKQIRLSITGMACAGCVAPVEKSLLQVEGISEAIVNLGEPEFGDRGEQRSTTT